MSQFNINFMQFRRIAVIASIVLLLLSVLSLVFRGLNLGLDFLGGTQIEITVDKPIELDNLRALLAEQEIEDATVVNFGSAFDISIRTALNINDEKAREIVQFIIEQNLATQVDIQKVEYVGPQIGEELREDGGLGLFVALILVMLYVALKFQYKFSIAAVLALFHDVIICIGLFSIFQWNFDLTVIAALLAIIGYSLNDTIVVSDRIRENIRLSKKSINITELLNQSISQIFNRTIITSGTTLFVVIVLFVFGGETLRSLSITLIIGIFIGTYSSIFIATSVLLALGLVREDMIEKKTQQTEGEPINF